MTDNNSYSPLDPKSAGLVTDQLTLQKVPEQYRATVQQAAQQNNLPVGTLVSMLSNESSFNPNAVGPMTKHGQAIGMSQMLPITAAGLGYSPQDLMDPVKSIQAGAQYLGQQFQKYGNPDYALGAYNTGPGNMDKILAGHMQMPAETAAYIQKAHMLDNTPMVTQRQSVPNQTIGLTGMANTSDTASNLNAAGGPTSGMLARSPFPDYKPSQLPAWQQSDNENIDELPSAPGLAAIASSFLQKNNMKRNMLEDDTQS